MSRPLRADAARNRARVLEAADEVFGEQGPAGSTEEVARRAGVGVATVFRHFPTKADLLAAVLAARLRRVADRAAELAASDDPATAFRGFFREAVLQSTAKTLLTEALTDAGATSAPPAGRSRATCARRSARCWPAPSGWARCAPTSASSRSSRCSRPRPGRWS